MTLPVLAPSQEAPRRILWPSRTGSSAQEIVLGPYFAGETTYPLTLTLINYDRKVQRVSAANPPIFTWWTDGNTVPTTGVLTIESARLGWVKVVLPRMTEVGVWHGRIFIPGTPDYDLAAIRANVVAAPVVVDGTTSGGGQVHDPSIRLSGNSAGVSTTLAGSALVVARGLSGSSAGGSTSFGSLQVLAPNLLAGSSVGLSTTVGTLSREVGETGSSAGTSTTTATTLQVFSTNGFVHPGIMGLTQSRLDYTKDRITASAEPWLSSYNKMRTSGQARAVPGGARTTNILFATTGTFTPNPVPRLLDDTTGTGTNAQTTLYPFLDDATAAYAQALMWAYNGATIHRTNAISIMNAWSAALTGMDAKSSTATNPVAGGQESPRLYGAWAGTLWARAAEIIRYTGGGAWSSGSITAFENMLRNVILPHLDWSNAGNWAMTFAEARIDIGVFLSDSSVFNFGLSYFRDRLLTAVTMPTDTLAQRRPRNATDPPLPTAGGAQYSSSGVTTLDQVAAYWYFTSDATSQYVSGLVQEHGRDFGHSVDTIGAVFQACETAYAQGIDLYGEFADRLRLMAEIHAAWYREALKYKTDNALSESAVNTSGWNPVGRYNITTGAADSTGRPWVSQTGNGFTWGGGSADYGWELAYRHFNQRLGYPMANVKALLSGWTDGGTYGNLRGSPGGLNAGPLGAANHMCWPTLTSAVDNTYLAAYGSYY